MNCKRLLDKHNCPIFLLSIRENTYGMSSFWVSNKLIILESFVLKCRFISINTLSNGIMSFALRRHLHTSLKTMCFSVAVSFTLWFYFKLFQTTGTLLLRTKTKPKNEQSIYPCITLCPLDLFTDLFEGTLKQDVENFSLANYPVSYTHLTLPTKA